MDYENILYEPKDGIGWITINRPKAMNALSTSLLAELCDAIKTVEENGDIRAVVILGAGEKAFSAGADLGEIKDLKIRGAFDYSRAAHRAFNAIEQCAKPVIACINGLAMGGGAELALSCHIRVASEGAKIGFPESGLGGIPGMGGTQRLPRLIGKGVALSCLLTGDMIRAEQGLNCGLYYKIFPNEEVVQGAEALAKKLLQKSPLSLKFIIQAVTNGLEGNIEEGLVLEAALMAALKNSEDAKEGLKAIFEKRPPTFKGE
jgi:enoyl-CoA hydratase